MPLVTFTSAGLSVEVEPGTSLLEAARQAGLRIRNDCGGQGVCGRCLVEIRSGQMHRLNAPQQDSERQALACRTLVLDSEVVVHVPESSREAGARVTVSRTGFGGPESPPAEGIVREVRVPVPAPTLEDHLPDEELLVRTIADRNQGQYIVPPDVLKDLPSGLRQADWNPHLTLAHGRCCHEVLQVERNGSAWVPMLALDVGTTSLKAQLIAPGGRYAASCYNSQIAYGPDVISRIIHAQQHEEGLAQLQGLVVGDINRMLTALLGKADLEGEHVMAVVAGGNTTMLHLRSWAWMVPSSAAGYGDGPAATEYGYAPSLPAAGLCPITSWTACSCGHPSIDS